MDTEMRILFLTGVSRMAGGVFYAVSSLCRALEAFGTGISVFGRNDPFASEDGVSWHPAPVTLYRAVGPLGLSMELRRLLRSEPVDICHLHGLWLDDQWAMLQWHKRTGRPMVISPHGMLDPWALRNAAWKKRLVGRLFAFESLAKATCIHALCRSEVDSIRRFGLKNPIAVIPNGVELPKINFSNSKPQTPRRKKQLLFLGRIHPKKGLAELIRAWSLNHGVWRKDWTLLIAGWDDGGHERRLREMADGLDVADSVSFLGPKYEDEKDALLRSVDAFILPSFSEGLPMSVLEAWSYSLPVIMTDSCNIPEGFAAGAAMAIDSNAKSISKGLRRLAVMSDNDLGAMGANGRMLVEDKFHWPRIAEQMTQVYEWCLTGRNPPECLILT